MIAALVAGVAFSIGNYFNDKADENQDNIFGGPLEFVGGLFVCLGQGIVIVFVIAGLAIVGAATLLGYLNG